MRLPQKHTRASRLHDEQGLFLETRLEGDPACQDLAAKWTAAQDKLRAALKACTDARVAAMRALAVRETLDDALDTQVRLLHRTIMALVRNNSRSGLMQTYFPKGSPAVTEVLPRIEISEVEVLLTKLASATDERVGAHAQPLRTALDAFRTAVQAHEAAAQTLKTAQSVEQSARLEWFTGYEKLYHDVSGRFTDTPSKVETFFLPGDRYRSRVEDDEEDAEDPADATPAAVTSVSASAAAQPIVADRIPASGRGGESA